MLKLNKVNVISAFVLIVAVSLTIYAFSLTDSNVETVIENEEVASTTVEQLVESVIEPVVEVDGK